MSAAGLKDLLERIREHPAFPELLKAMDWHRADLVKSPKLYFRNWVHRASGQAPEAELTPEQARARLAIV